MDRSVNLESNAFIGSILDGVVSTEEDDAGGAVETEVAFTPSLLAASSVGFILAAVGSAEGFEVLREFAALESNDMSCWLF